MSKKGISVMLIGLMVLAMLISCAPAATPTPIVRVETKVIREVVTATPEPTKPPEVFKVALILPSTMDDMAWSQSMYEGVKAVKEEMGDAMEFTVSENLYKIVDAGAAVRDYAERGYDLIICHGAQYQTLLQEIAPEYPNISFAYGTGFQTGPNIFAYAPAAEQGGYLLGMLAAAMTKSKIVGIVGPVRGGDAIKYNEGFKQGVAAQDPSVVVLETYTGSFADFVKANEMAIAHMDAGADILTGTAQQSVAMTKAAAERPGVYVLNSDMEQTSLAPDTCLAAQVYIWDEVVRRMIKLHQAGILGGEHLVLDYANGKLELRYNPKLEHLIPQEVKAKIEATKQAIMRGELVIELPKE
ncbi:MAG: BMP family protein [Chloroflexi bacterium]|nr:BMP family protein [Chloroflexota bacterium]